MSQVISVRLSDSDFEALQAQAQNAQLRTGTFVADILHAHIKGKATCSICGDPADPSLQGVVDELRVVAGELDTIHTFLRRRKFAAANVERQ